MTQARILPRSGVFRSRLQRLIRKHVWQMDIHPSARIAKTALIDRTFPKGIHIRADVVIDEEAVVLTHDMSRGVYLHTEIGENTIIGARAIILPGITVGRDCVVMPGALVNRDVPPGSRVMGNPAKVVEADGAHG